VAHCTEPVGTDALPLTITAQVVAAGYATGLGLQVTFVTLGSLAVTVWASGAETLGFKREDAFGEKFAVIWWDPGGRLEVAHEATRF
jgi:hypothetical protein